MPNEDPQSLPDTFETRQGEELRKAVDAGDQAKAEEIEQRISHSARTPEEAKQLRDVVHATKLFTELMEAETEEERDALTARMRDECSDYARKNAMAAGYLQAGLREGLPGDRLDQLVGWVDELGMGEEERALVRKIKRLKDPPPPPARWEPPAPSQLPEIRAELIDHYGGDPALVTMREALRAGRSNIVPEVPGLDASPDAVAAQILVRSERRRLADARLYYATADMTALALAAAQTPPHEPVSLSRPPSPSGLMLFAEPIGGYVEDVGAALASTMAARSGVDVKVTTPIVGVSWSVWTPDAVQLDRGTVEWLWNRGEGVGRIPRNYRGLWVTFYSPRGLFSGLAPNTVIGTMRDGTVMTAGMVESGGREAGTPLLGWDNEILLAEGGALGPAQPDTTDAWTHVLYSAWQLMAAEGRSRWAEVEEIPRPRAGAKRDARQGITAPGTVRVVHVHSARRPPRQRVAEDAAASSGRREPQWSCRWPVSPHRRDHCMNPARHAEGDCQHEERLIPGYVKGPKDKPLRVRDTVHLWDRQPDTQ